MLACAVDATARNSIRKDQSKGAPHVKRVSFGIRAFTLIELLIVVAIIAILAAIAVPNFLEAQVRAKVSRARADMRSAATAIEARAVDKNGGGGQTYTLMRMYADPTYPARPVHDFLEGGGNRAFNQASLPIDLTTPIAYITSLFNDPFKNASSVRKNTAGAVITPAVVVATDKTTLHFRYDNISQLTTLAGFGFNEADLAEYGAWRLTSIGPDNEFFGSIGRRIYDATNGTVSLGDILRTQNSSEGISKESTSGSN